MGWIQIVFYLIQNIPSLVSVVQKLIELIQNRPKAEQHWVKDQMKSAIEEHKATGDVSAIHKLCTGVGCPIDTVKE